ncbi:hypothetical protein YPPY34_2122, partial [Yersinia pestis PY-34]
MENLSKNPTYSIAEVVLIGVIVADSLGATSAQATERT